MSVKCVPVKATLSARGDEGLTTAMWSHVESCSSCQADLADDRLIREDLKALAGVVHTAPAGTMPRVMASVGPWAVPDPEPSTTGPSAKVLAAAAVATAAATAAASTVVILTRYRHRAA